MCSVVDCCEVRMAWLNCCTFTFVVHFCTRCVLTSSVFLRVLGLSSWLLPFRIPWIVDSLGIFLWCANFFANKSAHHRRIPKESTSHGIRIGRNQEDNPSRRRNTEEVSTHRVQKWTTKVKVQHFNQAIRTSQQSTTEHIHFNTASIYDSAEHPGGKMKVTVN
jgi:hypothetical protein